MKKLILGLLSGVIVGAIVVVIIEYIGHSMYPIPANLDFKNKQQMAKYISELPIGALIFVLLAWSIGVGLGSLQQLLPKRKLYLEVLLVLSF